MRNLHEDRKFVCDHCGYKCVSEAKLILHKVSHRKERSFKCEQCPLSFKDLKGWKTHQTAHENKKFECYLCAKKFRSLVTIRIHMGCHIESLKTFACDFCPKKYGRLVDRDRHLAVHTGEFVKCDICSKEYRTAKALEHHVELVHQGVRYNCKYCPQSLASRRQLYEHLFLHRGFKVKFYLFKFKEDSIIQFLDHESQSLVFSPTTVRTAVEPF
jgi:Zinc finger, C2H2 type